MRRQEIASAAAAATGGGLLMTAAFEPYNLWFFAWLAPALLIWAAHKSGSVISAGFLGLLFGLVHYSSSIPWIQTVVAQYSALADPIPLGLMLLLALYLALYPAAFALLLKILFRHYCQWALAATPLLWAALEYMRSFMLSGFPWNPLGNSQVSFLPGLQVADLGGVYLVSAVLVACSAGLVAVLLRPGDRPVPGGPVAIGASVVVILSLLYGVWQLSRPLPDEGYIDVALIQDEYDNAGRLAVNQTDLFNYYVDNTLEAVEAGADLVVWGEGALPTLDMYGDAEADGGAPRGFAEQYVLSLPRDENFWLLMGSSDFLGESYDLFNIALTAGPGNRGAADGRYAKVHLTPFGEYVPFQFLFSWLDKIVPEIGSFKTGDTVHTLPLIGGQVGTPICLEIIFPGLVRTFAASGAGLLVTISNDAWFGHEAVANNQHFSHAVVRAVENRRFLARCAVSGVSGIISPRGEVMARSETYVNQVIRGKVAFMQDVSLYTGLGDWFAFISIVACITLLLSIRFLQRRKANAAV